MATSDRRKVGEFPGIRRFAGLWAVCASLLLAACSTDGTPFEGMFGDPPLPPRCPKVRVLQEAAGVTQFIDGPGRDLTDVVAEARIADFQARCLYDVDDETGEGEVAVEIRVGIEAARGPADSDGRAEFPYFVSIADEDRNVLTKSVFRMPFRFTANAFRLVKFDEPLLLRIPIEPPQRGDRYLIYIGLQLTREEYEYNKNNMPSLLGG